MNLERSSVIRSMMDTWSNHLERQKSQTTERIQREAATEFTRQVPIGSQESYVEEGFDKIGGLQRKFTPTQFDFDKGITSCQRH